MRQWEVLLTVVIPLLRDLQLHGAPLLSLWHALKYNVLLSKMAFNYLLPRRGNGQQAASALRKGHWALKKKSDGPTYI